MRLIDADALKKRMVNEPVKAVQDVDFQAEWFTRIADTVCHMIDMVDEAPTVAAPRWHRVEEPPKDACDCLVCWTTIHDAETGEVTGHGFWCEKGWYEDGLLGEGFYCQSREETHPVRVEPDYWMPIPEPPKEEEHGN